MLKVTASIIPYSLNNIRGNKKEGALGLPRWRVDGGALPDSCNPHKNVKKEQRTHDERYQTNDIPFVF